MIVRDRITIAELDRLAKATFGDLVKAVVDIDREVMAVGADFHADDEASLLDDGSAQGSLWGINLYPAAHGSPDWLEFDSMINLRPSHGNKTRSVDDTMTRHRIAEIVDHLVSP